MPEKAKHYVLQVVEDVEPVLHGPYDDNAERCAKARELRKADRNDLKDGLYKLTITPQGRLIADTFRGADHLGD